MANAIIHLFTLPSLETPDTKSRMQATTDIYTQSNDDSKMLIATNTVSRSYDTRTGIHEPEATASKQYMRCVVVYDVKSKNIMYYC